MGSSSFCSMGGMTMSSNGGGNKSETTKSHARRTLWEVNSSGGDIIHKIGYDMPVILTDDGKNVENDGGYDKHDMNGMDNEGRNMDHNMDHNMDNDDSSHGMSMMDSGTIMYMDGFHSALFHSSSQNPPPCLNLFFPSWTLDNPTKFVFAMMFIMLLGVMVEACGVWRVRCLRTKRHIRRQERLKRSPQLQNQRPQSSDDSSEGHGRVFAVCPAMFRRAFRKAVPQYVIKKCCKSNRGDTSKNGKRYEIMAASLHAVRAWIGYLLMLAVMSYAIEFLVCAILGMVLGRYWFIDEKDDGNGVIGTVSAGNGDQGSGVSESFDDFRGGDGTWGGGDPCCGIDDEDEDEYHDDMNYVSEVENRSGLVSRSGLLSRSSLVGGDTLQGSAVDEPLLINSGASRRSII
ncbi:hypothetical protein HJC23_005404 [Cyclotella cryptica]|uniref:Copper transport protein n=1 Tax=Cyclotella cryptica TaxID=29204 RepID=A0ABD3P296_9STRA